MLRGGADKEVDDITEGRMSREVLPSGGATSGGGLAKAFASFCKQKGNDFLPVAQYRDHSKRLELRNLGAKSKE